MKFAEFHEQEFEGFLYSQLERADRRLWHPHEVLEHHLGFDRALFLTDHYLWRLKGHSRPLRGFAPYYFYEMWPGLAAAGIPRDRLPRFRLNCFLQAKRPEYSARVPKVASSLSPRRPVFRFSIEDDQQNTLDRVANTMRNRAIFSYASPVFGRSSELFKHGTHGTVVEHTTFPDVTSMKGHQRWYYNEPGAKGLRNPDFEPVDLPPLASRIDALAQDIGEVGSFSDELASLSEVVRSAVLSDNAVPSAREAYLANEWRAIDAFSDSVDAPRAVWAYLSVDAFARAFRLGWLAIAENAV